MSKLTWDGTGEKKYENGISHGVLYKLTGTGANAKWSGVAWNGLTSVSESPEGGDPNDLYADNIKYATLRGAETFGGTIEAYTYPDEFESCDGSATPDGAEGLVVHQQTREMFRMSYRTEEGNDNMGSATNLYKIHVVYGATCSPSERSYETINDSPDAITFSWEFDTTPVNVTGLKPTSLITIDASKLSAAQLAAVEDALYGTQSSDPYCPDPDDLIALIA